MKRKIIAGVAILYALTWMGGWITHSRELQASAWQMYADAKKQDREMAELFQKEGHGLYYAPDHLSSKNGPSAKVNWCVPILPGVLLANSYYVIGPLWGKGGVKIVLYYVFGAKELVYISRWVS